MGEEAMQKRYNLATPELIAKLIEVGAKTDTARSNGTLQYRVRVPASASGVVNTLLTGTKLRRTHKLYFSFYSKDVWNTLAKIEERRNSYGHLEDQIKIVKHVHCGLPVRAFKFTDGKIIRLCQNLQCTVFDAHRQNVLRGGL